MLTPQRRERLFNELVELLQRIVKLEAFTQTVEHSQLHAIEVEDLAEQLGFMRGYAWVLARRVYRLLGEH